MLLFYSPSSYVKPQRKDYNSVRWRWHFTNTSESWKEEVIQLSTAVGYMTLSEKLTSMMLWMRAP